MDKAAARPRDEPPDWYAYLCRFPNEQGLDRFQEIEPMLGDREYWDLLGEAWTCSDMSYSRREEWRRLFTADRPERNYLMTRSEHDELAGLPDIVQVFRGYSHADGWDGLAWTLSEAKAVWFARVFSCGPRAAYIRARLGLPPLAEPEAVIARASAPRESITALFNRRDEAEVVIVDPSALSGLTITKVREPADERVEATGVVPPE